MDSPGADATGDDLDDRIGGPVERRRQYGGAGPRPGSFPRRAAARVGRGGGLPLSVVIRASLDRGDHTNRQIAERFSSTVSTVEQHRTKVYLKLNVLSRAELQRLMGGWTGV
ncbi:LuxR C-terminal-related transcriptional regulator [Micromonospora sp. NPDC049374]|uniref:LuxR C-terminal-related transcriptional regulator n=1 Tax=Micromonospora sp. NPDC049374 TaxID=3154352 RepID=UPI00343AF2EE